MRYLDKEAVRLIHQTLLEWSDQGGEPIPPFDRAKQDEIDALVATQSQSFFGIEAYPTLLEKAAIIFYTINKKQIFLNGNKRMSTLCLLVFLGINDKKLNISSDDLTRKALWLANTASQDFPKVKEELLEWLHQHVQNM